jgi:N-acetylmuramoyl-L-alanine amidase
MARVLAYKATDDAALASARELLRRAAEAEVGGPAPCRAFADRVQLEAGDGGDLARAHALAREAMERFRGVEAAAGCVARLTQVVHALAAFPGEGSERATLRRMTLYGKDAEAPVGVRLVLELDRPAMPESIDRPAQGTTPRRHRLALEGVGVAADVAPAVEVGAAGLVAYRVVELPGGTARVELDLEPEAIVRRFTLDAPPRAVVEVALPHAQRQAGAVVRRVVLDPGHGGDEWGASNGGVRESHLAFDIARRTAHSLRARLPGMEVLLTRTDDVVVSLEARTAMANAAGADLFVSIHLNDSEVAIAHGGVTTFVLDTTEDAQALRLAARENGTTTAEVTGMTRLLAELQREDQVLASRRLADRVQQALLSRGRAVLPELADRGVRSALFAVLVGARMPAVLVEASFLTDPDELRALRTSRYRQALAEGIAEGIVHYVHGE